MPPPFHVNFTRDHLDDSGQPPEGDFGPGLLSSAAHVSYAFLETYHETLTPDQIAGSDGLIVNGPRVTAATFAGGAERLTLIARAGAGFEKVDLAACTAHDVLVTHAPEAVSLATASGSLAFMLALSKRLFEMDRITRQGRWDLRMNVMGFDLAGRTLGIVGLGHAGRELARLAAPFGMRVLAYSPHADADQARALNVELTTLDDVLRQSDFVCLHCRLTEATRGMIGAAELALMKPEAYLINMARGPVVDHGALVEALRERRIAGAGLDVFDQEPLPADDPVLALDNVILAPHWIAGTQDAFVAAGRANCAAMLAAAHGQLPERILNPDVLAQPGFRAKLGRWQTG